MGDGGGNLSLLPSGERRVTPPLISSDRIFKMLAIVGKSPTKFIWLIKMQFNSSSEKYTEVNAHLTVIWYCTTNLNVVIIKFNYSSTPVYSTQLHEAKKPKTSN